MVSAKTLRIAILGTRGIPNRYGGFEQFAEYLSVGLAEKGHEVTVYNPHFHTVTGSEFKGVKIRYKYSPENLLGASANFIYDYLSLKDALNRGFDIILECGYGTASPSFKVLNLEKSVVLTNMDGMEWKREKWSRVTQWLMRKFEKWGVEESHGLIADNPGIAEYLHKQYDKRSRMIPYGASIFRKPEIDVLNMMGCEPGGYFLVVARLEPENNIKTIFDGYLDAKNETPLIVVGSKKTAYAKRLIREYGADHRIRFTDSIYERKILNTLRYHCQLYFHGHSVGGTNPSLLEAMACSSLIAAHKNPFNQSVLNGDAFYFENREDIKDLLSTNTLNREKREQMIRNNLSKIEKRYNWTTIVNEYESYFRSLLI